jgi:hypothetical protein
MVGPHLLDDHGPSVCVSVCVYVCVCLCGIFSPVKPNARLPRSIGRPAACLAYLSILGTNKVNSSRCRCLTTRSSPSQVQALYIKCEPVHVHKYVSRAK